MTLVETDYKAYLLGATAEYNKKSLKQREQLDGYRRDNQLERKGEKMGRDSAAIESERAFDDPVAPI